ncbi:MAG: hypothetical protein WCT22_04630 [Patescibacteria group bacterium]
MDKNEKPRHHSDETFSTISATNLLVQALMNCSNPNVGKFIADALSIAVKATTKKPVKGKK